MELHGNGDPRPRRAGSARFDPYWKVQWWDRTSLAWRDIQQAHQTREAAQAAAAAHWAANGEPEVRLIRISDDGQRRPEPTKIMRIPEAAAKALRTSPHNKTTAADHAGRFGTFGPGVKWVSDPDTKPSEEKP